MLCGFGRIVRVFPGLVPAVCAAMLLSASSVAIAQDPPVNATLVGTWDGYNGNYADIWADGDFVYIGSFTLQGPLLEASVHIVDISDPANPTLAATYFPPSPNNFRSPQDVKVAEGLLFIGLESGGTDLVEIVDVRDPTNPVRLTSLSATGFDRCHNTFYDEGFLYVVDSNTPRVIVYDLRTYDPDNAPATIDTPLWVIENVGSVFVHDVTAKDGRLYAAGWDSGLFIYDISDVANTAPALIGNVGGNNTHSMWPTDDGEYVITGEERGGGGVQVYRITDLGGALGLTQTDSLVLSDDAYSVHNQVVVGNRVYISWYQAGLQVYDINDVSGELEFIASYDTSVFDGDSFGFQGCWGVYPLLGEDKIVLSDLEEGMFVVNVQEPLVNINYPDGFPSLSDPSGGTPIRVEVTADIETPDPAGIMLFTRVDGGAFTGTSMSFDGSAYVASLPSAPCGATVDYYVSIDTLEGSTVTDPLGAPTSFRSALAGLGFADISIEDFESDPGWSVSGDASDGQWVRGIPLAECDRGNPMADYDGSGSCFLTDNVLGPGDDCNNDVDGGTTILTTTSYDMSSLAVPYVRYARWFSNNSGGSPNEDIMLVEVSNNGGASWSTLETVGPAGSDSSGGWILSATRVDDVIGVTNDMQFRFSAEDLPAGSVVEAGIDDFRIQELVCVVDETPAEITAQPQPLALCEGETAVFSVSADGAQPLSFQWRFEGADIPDETSSLLSLPGVTAGDAGSYTCFVSNAFGSEVSASASLSVTTLASCDDGNACTADTCSAATCSNTDDTPAGECCDPVSGDLTTIDDGNDCSTDTCDPLTGEVSYSVAIPSLTGAGGRSLEATPNIACGDAVALVVTSDSLPCFESYVAADGTLSGTPIFQTAAAWSDVVITGEEIIPETTYNVQSELPGGSRSLVATGTTWQWGDIDNNTAINFADVQLVVFGFQLNFQQVTLAASDLEPCTPNGLVNFADILRAVGAFQSQSYADTGCPIPCE